MNIRDNTTECGYCGGKIPRRTDKSPSDKAGSVAGSGTARPGQRALPKSEEPAAEGDEEEGGLSAILQQGEQVLIGSLNISVKKFFFHAYLTNQRIFLVDTQEKKLKVTAKDIPRDTIVGSIVEFSENSDPVLVLSIKSADDEVKTMKLVFVQNGMDRSGEIDEWIALMHEEKAPKKGARAPVEEEEPEEPVIREIDEPEFVVERPVPKKQELQPIRKPAKEHEKQPPVKKLLSLYKVPEEEPPKSAEPAHRPQVRSVTEQQRKPVVTRDIDRQIVSREQETPIRKPEVQSAMKIAMKGAVQPTRQPVSVPVKRTAPEYVQRQTEYEEEKPVKKPAAQRVHEEYEEVIERPRPQVREQLEHEEPAAGTPQFCHHCGKRLPHAANFCPGCGTRLSRKTVQPATPSHTRTIPREKVVAPVEPDEDEEEEQVGEKPVPAKPPVKKAPRGSEMTILHKFLRR